MLSNALNTKGLWTLAHTNRREESRSLLLGALRVALAGNEPQAAMRAYFNLSFEREGVDDYTHSFDTDGLALAERTGDQQWKRSFLLHTSFTAVEQGDWDEAMRITHEVEESPGAETDHFARGILLTRSIIFARRGEVEKARAAIAGSGFEDPMADEQNLAQLWLARSEALAGEGRFAEAAAAGAHGAAGAATLGIGHPAVKSSLIVGSWCAYRAGDRAAAAAALEQLEALPAGVALASAGCASRPFACASGRTRRRARAVPGGRRGGPRGGQPLASGHRARRAGERRHRCGRGARRARGDPAAPGRRRRARAARAARARGPGGHRSVGASGDSPHPGTVPCGRWGARRGAPPAGYSSSGTGGMNGGSAPGLGVRSISPFGPTWPSPPTSASVYTGGSAKSST